MGEKTINEKMDDHLWDEIRKKEQIMKVVDAPKHKKDWVGKSLMLKEACLEGYLKPLDGVVVWIDRRLNAMDTHTTDLRNMPYKVFGRCLEENLMDFALIPGQ